MFSAIAIRNLTRVLISSALVDAVPQGSSEWNRISLKRRENMAVHPRRSAAKAMLKAVRTMWEIFQHS
jgi:hypothetical protein